MQFSISCILFLLVAAPSALAIPAAKGASYSTVTITSVSSTVISVTTDISTVIKKAGTKTIIPDVLTIAFSAVPATFSLHTTLLSTSYTTILSTSKVLIAASATSKTSAPTTSSSTSSTSPLPTAPTTGAYKCGQQGVANAAMSTYSDGYVFWVPQVHNSISAVDCRATCQQITQCQSYSYNPTAQVCTLYASPIDITPSTTSGAYFLGKYNTENLSNC